MGTPDAKTLAKAVIVEIIRQNGGTLNNKTHLFKAFWKAHVAAAQARSRPLTSYPIVRMPRGPGIHKVSVLLGELMAEGVITVDPPDGSQYSSFEFGLLDSGRYADLLSDDDRAAIQLGVASVRGKTTAQISEESHRDSRSWRSAQDGDELDIDLDAIPEDLYSELTEQVAAWRPRY